MYLRIVSNIPEMNIYRIPYINLRQRSTYTLAECTCILVCPVCSPKTWHSHTMYLLSWCLHPVKCPGHYQKGKCGIQSSGQPNHCTLAVYMIQSFFQSHSLYIQNFFTPQIPFFFFSRNKGSCREYTGQLCLFFLNMERNPLITTAICSWEGGHPSSLVCQTVHIDLSENHRIMESSALCQQYSVLSDHILSTENQILRGFPLTCSSINVSADQPCRLSGYKGSSVSILPYHLITGRKVHDHMSACLCMRYTWRLWNPKILTNLCCYCQFFTLITHKQQVCTKRNLNAVYLMSVHTVTA